jgi:hypothetical protein
MLEKKRISVTHFILDFYAGCIFYALWPSLHKYVSTPPKPFGEGSNGIWSDGYIIQVLPVDARVGASIVMSYILWRLAGFCVEGGIGAIRKRVGDIVFWGFSVSLFLMLMWFWLTFRAHGMIS